MWTRILLVVTLAFVIASTGHGFVRPVKPHFQFEPSTLRASLASAGNGSTLDEILQELHMRYRASKNLALLIIWHPLPND